MTTSFRMWELLRRRLKVMFTALKFVSREPILELGLFFTTRATWE
jgi:hypothetical protein